MVFPTKFSFDLIVGYEVKQLNVDERQDMKLIRYEQENKTYSGFLKKDEKTIIPISRESITSLIQNYTLHELNMIQAELMDDLTVFSVFLDEVTLLPPIEYPIHDILCVGKNYKDHELEVDRFFGEKQKKQDETVYFSKRCNVIIGQNGKVESIPFIDDELDYEVELAVIIGKKGKNIPIEKAKEYVFGYSVFNDYSSRKLQRKHMQWFKGKSIDSYTAMGPYIVTADEVNWPLELNISCLVNNELRQSSNTKVMITDVATIIHELSIGMTLEPGDIIATGTPAGVAMGMDEPKFLKAGDLVISEIEGIGKLVNTIV